MPQPSSLFNEQRSGNRVHRGEDYPGVAGTPIYAASKSQTVEFAGRQSGYGNVVILKDNRPENQGGPVKTVLAHLDSIPEGIKPGETVPPGTLIGYMGNTGNSYSKTPGGDGTHLHYEVRERNPVTGRYEAVNPTTTIDSATQKPYIFNAAFDRDKAISGLGSLRNTTGQRDPGYALREWTPPGQSMAAAPVTPQGQRQRTSAAITFPNRPTARRLAPGEFYINPVLKLGDR